MKFSQIPIVIALSLSLVSLMACKPEDETASESENSVSLTDSTKEPIQQASESKLVSAGYVELDIPAEVVAQLQAEPMISKQLGIIYKHFEPKLDRSVDVAGPDYNNNHIRDDIEAFILALEVEEPIRKALLQDARFSQMSMEHEFNDSKKINEDIAYNISLEYDRVLACYKYRDVEIEDIVGISRFMESISYNTKLRTRKYLEYNHLLDGAISTLLVAGEEYCE